MSFLSSLCVRPCSLSDVDAKEELIVIYELLFKEGLMLDKKHVHMTKQPKLADNDVPSLQVMQPLKT